jgi:hypothetical protein
MSVPTFTFKDPHRFEDMVVAMMDYAQKNPHITFVDRGPKGYLFLFGSNPKELAHQAEQLATAPVVSDNTATLSVDLDGLHGNQEFGDKTAKEEIKKAVQMLIEKFPETKITNNKDNQDLSDKPELLF